MGAIPKDAYWGLRPFLSVSFTQLTHPALRIGILDRMNTWASHGKVRFYQSPAGKPGVIRIDRVNGWSSEIGKRCLKVPLNQPTTAMAVSFANLEAETPSIIHEAGHVLGLDHEHIRPQIVRRLDPKRTIAYYQYWFGWSEMETRSYILTPLIEANYWLSLGGPDEQSIMCYYLPGYCTLDKRPIGKGIVSISQIDASFIGQVYH